MNKSGYALSILRIDKPRMNAVMLAPYSPSSTKAVMNFDPRDASYDKNEVRLFNLSH